MNLAGCEKQRFSLQALRIVGRCWRVWGVGASGSIPDAPMTLQAVLRRAERHAEAALETIMETDLAGGAPCLYRPPGAARPTRYVPRSVGSRGGSKRSLPRHGCRWVARDRLVVAGGNRGMQSKGEGAPR